LPAAKHAVVGLWACILLVLAFRLLPQPSGGHSSLILLPWFLLVFLLLLLPCVVKRMQTSAAVALALFSMLYCLPLIEIIRSGSITFFGDSAKYHYGIFWYFANSIAHGFGLPEWFPSAGGIPVGPVSTSLLLVMPHRLLGYAMYALLPVAPLDAYNSQLFIGMLLAGAGCWLFLFKWIGCRSSATFGALIFLMGGTGVTLHQEQAIATITWIPWILLSLLYIKPYPKVLLVTAILSGFALTAHQPQIQLLTLMSILLFVFVIPANGRQTLRSLIKPGRRRYLIVALPLFFFLRHLLQFICTSVKTTLLALYGQNPSINMRNSIPRRMRPFCRANQTGMPM